MNKLIGNMRNIMSKNSADSLLVGGVVCLLGAGVLAVRQTPKALRILEEKETATNMAKVKAVAPLYIPSVLLSGLGIAQIVWSRNITHNKLAALATAYTVSETAYRTYRNKVQDIVEPEKMEKIKREFASDILKNDPSTNKEVIISSRGEELIYDTMSGRYFRGSMEDIYRVENVLNKKLMNEMTISLNEFYSEINLPVVKVGCELGWKIERDNVSIGISAGLTEDGRPCLVLDYDVIPICV